MNPLNTCPMKKILLLCAACLVLLSGLQAQKRTTVKTDLFSVILRTGTLKLERALNEDISLQLGFLYTGYHPRLVETTLTGFGITPEFRYFLSATPAPNGTYLAPNARYLQLTVADPDVDDEGVLTNISFGLNLGYQVILKDLIVIDAWVGPTYNLRTLEATSEDIEVGIAEVNGFGLRIGVAIGLAF
jgi:hypothetical protein